MYQEYQTNCPIFEETEKSDFHLQRLGKPNDLHSFFVFREEEEEEQEEKEQEG